MSADNWATCPKCLKKQREKKARMLEKARGSYGVAPPEVYEDNMRRAMAEPEEPEESSLREDYELGISEEFEFYILYRARCENCDFEFEFKKEEKLT